MDEFADFAALDPQGENALQDLLLGLPNAHDDGVGDDDVGLPDTWFAVDGSAAQQEGLRQMSDALSSLNGTTDPPAYPAVIHDSFPPLELQGEGPIQFFGAATLPELRPNYGGPKSATLFPQPNNACLVCLYTRRCVHNHTYRRSTCLAHPIRKVTRYSLAYPASAPLPDHVAHPERWEAKEYGKQSRLLRVNASSGVALFDVTPLLQPGDPARREKPYIAAGAGAAAAAAAAAAATAAAVVAAVAPAAAAEPAVPPLHAEAGPPVLAPAAAALQAAAEAAAAPAAAAPPPVTAAEAAPGLLPLQVALQAAAAMDGGERAAVVARPQVRDYAAPVVVALRAAITRLDVSAFQAALRLVDPANSMTEVLDRLGRNVLHLLATPSDCFDDIGLIPLDEAAPRPQPEVLLMLEDVRVACGEEMWQKLVRQQDSKHSATPLNRASRYGHRQDVLVALLADARRKALLRTTKHDWRPLHSAARCGHVAATRINVQRMIDVLGTNQVSAMLVLDNKWFFRHDGPSVVEQACRGLGLDLGLVLGPAGVAAAGGAG